LDECLKLRIELRFNFDLKASYRVLENANTEYKTLANSCQVDLAICNKNQLKQSICLLVNPEIQVNKSDIAAHLCVAVGSLAMACTIATPAKHQKLPC
jgi:uncharacterized protein YueI